MKFGPEIIERMCDLENKTGQTVVGYGWNEEEGEVMCLGTGKPVFPFVESLFFELFNHNAFISVQAVNENCTLYYDDSKDISDLADRIDEVNNTLQSDHIEMKARYAANETHQVILEYRELRFFDTWNIVEERVGTYYELNLGDHYIWISDSDGLNLPKTGEEFCMCLYHKDDGGDPLYTYQGKA